MRGRERFNRRMNGTFMDEDLQKEDAALPLVVDQARQRLSGLNYPEADGLLSTWRGYSGNGTGAAG